MGRLRVGRRLLPLGSLLVIATLLAPAPVAAASADWATFGTPSATGSLAEAIEFVQPVDAERPIGRAEVLITIADALGQQVVPIELGDPDGAVMLRHTLEAEEAGALSPNTRLTARWRLTPADDPAAVVLGPEVSLLYRDERFEWKTVAGDIVRVHWYEGGQAFGERALRIGEEAVRDSSELLGVNEDEPVDFFIYADQEPFYDALGPGTRENVGGQANADIRTLFALISPSEIDAGWVATVVPHELTHLVFDTAVANPYHFPPRWLNEGVAVYLSEGYGASYRRDVEDAAGVGTLIPLDGLGGQFPTTADRFYLAYAESVSAVEFLIRTYGQDALVELIQSYADGRTDDEAFRDALGVDVTGFGAAWFEDLGAVAPAKHGPNPPVPGPRPEAWGGSGSVVDPAAPVDGPGAEPAPLPAGAWLVVLVVAGVLLLAAGVLVILRRRAVA